MAKRTKRGGGEAPASSPSTASTLPPPPFDRLAEHLSLDDPDSLALEVLSLYRQVREGSMDSSEAGRRANLLQVARNLTAPVVHKQLRELMHRLVDAKVLPASALKSLQARL